MSYSGPPMTSVGTIIKRDDGEEREEIRVQGNTEEGILDIRKYIKIPNYEGPTKQGIRLTRGEVSQLFQMRDKIAKLLGLSETDMLPEEEESNGKEEAEEETT